MEKFDYEILYSKETPQGPTWFVSSNNTAIGPNLLLALKKLGQVGWDIAATTDLGLTGRAEIILKRRV